MTSTWLQLSCWVWLCPWQCLVYAVVCTGWVSVQISRLLKFDDHARYRREDSFVWVLQFCHHSLLCSWSLCPCYSMPGSVADSQITAVFPQEHDKVHLTRAKSITIECLPCFASVPILYQSSTCATKTLDHELRELIKCREAWTATDHYCSHYIMSAFRTCRSTGPWMSGDMTRRPRVTTVYIFLAKTLQQIETPSTYRKAPLGDKSLTGHVKFECIAMEVIHRKELPYLEPEPPRSFDALAALDLCTPSFALCLGNVTACRSLYGVGSVTLVRLHVTSHNDTGIYRVTITMIQGDNWVANCVSVLEQEGWGWTHLF